MTKPKQHPGRVRLIPHPEPTERGPRFPVGGPGGPGRGKGNPNRITTDLRQAILQAAASLGSDNKGKDGLLGYLISAARNRNLYLPILARLLPHEIAATLVDDNKRVSTLGIAQVKARLRAKGIDPDSLFDGPAVLELQPAPVPEPTTDGSDKLH